jgi:preprotein translocase subunit Sss1
MFVPFWIRILLLFGRTSFIIGFLFTLIGMAFIIYFSMQLNWNILFAGKKDLVTTSGFITSLNETSYTVDENSLYEYRYRYHDQSQIPYSGFFLEYANSYETGQEITIEYLKESPEVSRFAGKDRQNYDQIMFLAGIGSIIIGILFLYPSYMRTRRERKIIMTGRPAEGKLVYAEPTNMRVNEQPVYKLTYEYLTSRDNMQKFSVRSHLIRNLSDDHTEILIYDPANPGKAVVIDTLPGPVARYILNKLYPSYN